LSSGGRLTAAEHSIARNALERDEKSCSLATIRAWQAQTLVVERW